MKTVILCGGAGTRLWPISRQSSPKQFARVFDNESLFEKTIKRNIPISDSFSVIVNETQLPICKSQVEGLDLKSVHFLVESVARNTAPAIALSAFASDPDEVLLVLPSDHLIKDLNLYEESIQKAMNLAKEGMLVTFGIEPLYPETGFGYIEAQGEKVLSFKEKPSLEKAKEYISKGNFYWNSGMFCFKASTFLNELEVHSPEIYTYCKKTYENNSNTDGTILFPKELMEQIPSDSIDYAVMEKSNNVGVVPTNFYWSDLGSFDSLYSELEKDSEGNTLFENHISLDSKNNLILGHKKVIATFDIEDLIIVDTEDAILIGKRNNSQNVKSLLEKVKSKFKSLLD